jgi:hypothetical protein
MKKTFLLSNFLIFISMLLLTNNSFSQSVGIGTSTPNTSAQLEIKSTTKGILIPRTSSVTRAAIVSPAKSLLLYDTTTNSFWFHNGSDWIELGRIDPTPANTFFGFQTASSLNLGVGNTGIGHQVLSANTDGGFNTALGYWSLLLNTTGYNNTAVGSNSLKNNTTGIENTAAGANALMNNTTGKDNVSVGLSSLVNNTAGNYNSVLGVESMNNNINGYNNTAIGYRALYFNQGGHDNVALGTNALLANISGFGNVGIGSKSLGSNSSGQYNVAIGDSALYNENGATDNIAIGYSSLFNNGTGSTNIAIGNSSLFKNSNGIRNVGVGDLSLDLNTTGSFNVALGTEALGANVSGSNNVAIGPVAGTSILGNTNVVLGAAANVSPGPNSISSSVALGWNAIVNSSNKVRIGGTSISVIEGQVAYSFPSDGRFKFNVSDQDVKGLDFIMRLHPVNYQFDTRKFDAFLKSGDPTAPKLSDQEYEESSAVIHNGFVAQEVEQAAKQSGFNFDGIHSPTNEKDNYSIAYSQFVVPLIKAMQEQQKLIETLQQKNEELERRILLLEKK